jgi:hypothetical protein
VIWKVANIQRKVLLRTTAQSEVNVAAQRECAAGSSGKFVVKCFPIMVAVLLENRVPRSGEFQNEF